jgi:hypothetical protein
MEDLMDLLSFGAGVMLGIIGTIALVIKHETKEDEE